MPGPEALRLDLTIIMRISTVRSIVANFLVGRCAIEAAQARWESIQCAKNMEFHKKL